MNSIDESRERLVQVERLLAGDAEHVLDALGLEALDEDVGCLALGHRQGRYPRPVTFIGVPPVARYAKSGDLHIAYIVAGRRSDLDLVWIPPWISQVEYLWSEAVARRA